MLLMLEIVLLVTASVRTRSILPLAIVTILGLFSLLLGSMFGVAAQGVLFMLDIVLIGGLIWLTIDPTALSHNN